ncbi:MAG: TetR family transcriptional regulator [Anaerolineae bacterium]|nr:TetR family transcriptional regulator [Anaerolineae bacterium]
MRKTKEEADITRQHLLQAALRIFSKEGYNAATLGTIAAEAEVTRGAIYHHFGSKPELYKALLAEYASQGGEIINEAVSEGGTLVDILTRALVRQMEALEDNPDLRATIELTLFKTAREPELEDVLQSQREQAEMLVQGLAGIMQQGIAEGLLRADLDPVTAARTYVAFQQGITYLWLFNTSAFSIKNRAESLARTFMTGLVAP